MVTLRKGDGHGGPSTMEPHSNRSCINSTKGHSVGRSGTNGQLAEKGNDPKEVETDKSMAYNSAGPQAQRTLVMEQSGQPGS